MSDLARRHFSINRWEQARLDAGKTRFPVLVPSKGRAGRVSPQVLSLSPTLVVEEQEAQAYAEAYPGVELKAFGPPNLGIAFARNQLKNLASGYTEGWFFMVDDDIGEFYARGADHDEPYPTSPVSALAFLEEEIVREERRGNPGCRLAMAAFPVYWRNDALDGQAHWNNHCYCCVALHAKRLLAIWYDETLPLKEDTDFVIQVLSAGWTTLRLHTHAFRMPVCGTEPGGLYSVYQQAKEREISERLARKWPGIVTLGPKAKKPKVDLSSFVFGSEESNRPMPRSAASLAPSTEHASGASFRPVFRRGKS